MKKSFLTLAPLFALLVAGASAQLAAGDDYKIDTDHASVIFRVSHLGLSWVHGRFNEFSGDFSIDKADPSKSRFNLTIQTKSIDTGVKKRDDHLRSDAFFDVEKYPTMTFKSTAVKVKDANTLEVTGDFTLHGQKKSITFQLLGGRTAETPKGVQRTGYSLSNFKIERKDYGMTGFLEAIPSPVYVTVNFEGTMKK